VVAVTDQKHLDELRKAPDEVLSFLKAVADVSLYLSSLYFAHRSFPMR
jgi:hypothetical protein